jgi:DNA (cytosine-5)-methyltransferase 1
MTHGSLFSGIGGWDLAATWMNWTNVFHCEIDKEKRFLLNYYWPNSDSLEDVTKELFDKYKNKIDVLTASFPCQPFSNSGEQLGETDDRYLVEQMLTAVFSIYPRWFVAENVYAITSPKFSHTFQYICASLENKGYKVQPYIIPATAVEGEHERNRVWIVAYSNSARLSGQGELLGQMQPTKIGNRETSRFINFIQRNALPFVCDSHYGFSRKLAEQALHGAGNAIVPQIAYEIFKAIEQYESNNI